MLNRVDFTSYRTIIFAALIVRVIAAIFSQGYGMHDDHFLIIEASASWVDGFDYNKWLPWTEGNRGMPEGHTFTYVGLNYLLFSVLKGIGIADPKILMLINRLIHALFSLLVVKYGFKITERLSNKKNAVIVGWLLALLWLWPFLSVRNLAEVAPIPFIMWAMWLVIKRDPGFITTDSLRKVKLYWINFFYAGLLLGLATSFRYQIGVFAIGVAAYYFFKWRFREFALICLGVLLVFCLTQGVVDYFIWGYPFAELHIYTTYNMNEGTGYIPNNNYAMYLMVLMGAFFPLGILMGIGFFKSYKKYLILFLPVILFIIFHTFYPSKQERFIMTVLPAFVILGVIGYESLLSRQFWSNAWKHCYRIFWILNIPLLFAACFTYSKKSRVEAMYYIYEQQLKPKRVLFELTGETSYSMAPRFYAQRWDFAITLRDKPTQPAYVNPNLRYDLIFFYDDYRIEERRAEFDTLYPNMTLGTVCRPSMVDRLLRWLNPRNKNEYIEVWKTNVQGGLFPDEVNY